MSLSFTNKNFCLAAFLLIALCAVASGQGVWLRTAAASGSGGSVTVGNSTQSAFDSGNKDFVLFSPVLTGTGSSGYTVNSISVYVGSPAAASWGVALYTDAGGPATLVCSATSGSTPSSGINTLSPSGCGTLPPNTLYWLAQETDSSTQQQGTAGSGSSCGPPTGIGSGFTNSAQGSFSFPSTAPAFTIDAPDNGGYLCYTEYASLTCVGPCTSSYSYAGDVFIDFEGGSNGSSFTTGTLNTSIHCNGTCGTWSVSGTNTQMTYATAGQLASLLNPFTVNGTSYNGSGSLGFQWATCSGSCGEGITYSLPSGTYTQVSVGHWFQTSIPQTESDGNRYSMTTIQAAGAADEANDQIIPLNPVATELLLGLETPNGISPGRMLLASNSRYFVAITYVKGGPHQMRVFDSTGAIVGAMSNTTPNNAAPATVSMGISGGESETIGSDFWNDDIEISYSGAALAP